MPSHDKPVAIVLTGHPGTGKSTLSIGLFDRHKGATRRYHIVSKDTCKAVIATLRDDIGRENTERVDPWRDVINLRHRLSCAWEMLAPDEAIGLPFAEFGGELESCCAEQLFRLATAFDHALDATERHDASLIRLEGPMFPDENLINAWSYQLMLSVTGFVLGKHHNVILDAPLYRREVVRGLGEVLSRSGSNVFVFTCFVKDQKLWDDRLRKRKSREVGNDLVKKPGSVGEVMAIYSGDTARRKECDEVDDMISQWDAAARVSIDTGTLSIEDQVHTVIRSMQRT